MPGSSPSWSGLLQFNLVNARSRPTPAVASCEISHFHRVHADCGQRIRHAKHCPVHGQVDAAAIVKGYEYGRDQHVVIDPDELDALRPAQDRALRLERFVRRANAIRSCSPTRKLHLLPDCVAAEPVYEVLREILVQKARWAVGRSGAQRPAPTGPAAGSAGTLLLLHVLHYPQTIRAAARPSSGRCGRGPEMQLAVSTHRRGLPGRGLVGLCGPNRRGIAGPGRGENPGPDAASGRTSGGGLAFAGALQQSVAQLEPVEKTSSRSPGRLPQKRGRRSA